MNYTILFDTIMLFFILHIFTYYTSCKICNNLFNKLNFITLIVVLSFMLSLLNLYNPPLLYKLLLMLISCTLLVFIYFNHSLQHSIIISIISLLINYCIYFITMFIAYIICFMLGIFNHLFSLILHCILHYILLKKIFGIRRFKNGFFIVHEKYTTNIYFTFILIFLFVLITLLIAQFPVKNDFYSFCVALLLTLVLFIVYRIIKRAITFNYKQRLIKRELEDLRAEIIEKDKIIREKDFEINTLLTQNKKTIKTFHTISHRHDALEFKAKKLEMKVEIGSLADMYNLGPMPLLKVGIKKVDNILEYFQNECYKKKIDFDLQICENITDFDQLISESSLEILLADLIKNAIISIEYSQSTNNCILVKIGEINGIYSVYVYDSGIQFNINTYSTLGLSPSSSHLDSGGTGMGFLNVFDTLTQYHASLSISEIGPISDDNYTKSIAIKFDGLTSFSIYSYRNDILNSNIQNTNNRIIIEKYLS